MKGHLIEDPDSSIKIAVSLLMQSTIFGDNSFIRELEHADIHILVVYYFLCTVNCVMFTFSRLCYACCNIVFAPVESAFAPV